MTYTDVSEHDCPHCTRLICDDWSTCPGYLRDLCDRLEQPTDPLKPCDRRMVRA